MISWILLLGVDVICMSCKCSPHQTLFFPNSFTALLHLDRLCFINILQYMKLTEIWAKPRTIFWRVSGWNSFFMWKMIQFEKINIPHVGFSLEWHRRMKGLGGRPCRIEWRRGGRLLWRGWWAWRTLFLPFNGTVKRATGTERRDSLCNEFIEYAKVERGSYWRVK